MKPPTWCSVTMIRYVTALHVTDRVKPFPTTAFYTYNIEPVLLKFLGPKPTWKRDELHFIGRGFGWVRLETDAHPSGYVHAWRVWVEPMVRSSMYLDCEPQLLKGERDGVHA